MALVNCSECGKQISDRAAACPNCGNPMISPAAPPRLTDIASTPAVEITRASVITTEQTSKHHKGMQLAGAGVMCLGMGSSAAAAGSGNAGIGMVIFFLGAILYCAGRVGAWWHHG
ncbi:MAG TPA: zinc ribbon domain-containing protein [Burkholderiales bacterium]|nr:zinc ribbon domain-containing protein [Burkholderiales bacterium]